MSGIELWRAAGQASREVAILLVYPPQQSELDERVVAKALNKSRSATAALEALQRLSVGCEAPRKGD